MDIFELPLYLSLLQAKKETILNSALQSFMFARLQKSHYPS
jgi:hypothetical protein